MTTRAIVRRERVGPFVVLTCDDASEWLALDDGAPQKRRPGAPLTVARLRHVVRAIDDVPDHRALGKLESMIAEKYTGDVAARALLDYCTARSRSLADAPLRLATGT